MNAMEWNRDLRLTVAELREREKGMTDKPDREKNTVSFPEMRKGNIGLCVATQIARYVKKGKSLPGWQSPEQAWAQTQGQLEWYKTMEDCGEMVRITDLAGLKTHLRNKGLTDKLPDNEFMEVKIVDGIHFIYLDGKALPKLVDTKIEQSADGLECCSVTATFLAKLKLAKPTKSH